MNVGNVLGITYYAAHIAAGTLRLIFEMGTASLLKAGSKAWTIPAGCLVLLALDLSGRISLRGSGQKMIAAWTLPALCGWMEVLIWEEKEPFRAAPAICAGAVSLLLLAGYALLRTESGEASLTQAAAMLAQGNSLAAAGVTWLLLMAGAVCFMATFGLLFSLIIGGLIASRNSLLDYGGLKGILLGLLLLYGFRVLWYIRGLRLAKQMEPELDTGNLRAALFFPIWGGREARKLIRRIQLLGVKHYD